MSRDYPQYKLRMSPELKDTIDRLATKNNRSMNAEIVARLEASIAQEEKPQKTMNMIFDDDWFDETGLSKEEFGTFVRMAVQNNIAQYKVNKGWDDKN